MFYGLNNWDPHLIITQIVTIQFFYYFFLGIICFLFDLFFGISIHLDQIFSYKWIEINNLEGIITIISFLLNSIIMYIKNFFFSFYIKFFFSAFCLVYIIERAKKCLDFSGFFMNIINFLSH